MNSRYKKLRTAIRFVFTAVVIFDIALSPLAIQAAHAGTNDPVQPNPPLNQSATELDGVETNIQLPAVPGPDGIPVSREIDITQFVVTNDPEYNLMVRAAEEAVDEA